MKKILCSFLGLTVFFSLGFFLESSAAPNPAAGDNPKPKAPFLPRITSVDQLVPFAKIVLQRDYIGQRLGWSIKGGERVLLMFNNTTHPLVREAFAQALREMNCPTDVVIREGRMPSWIRGTKEWADEALRLKRERLALDLNTIPTKTYPAWGRSGTPRPVKTGGMPITREDLQKYDVIVGPAVGPRNQTGLAGGFWWAKTPEMLASAGTVYPGELLDFIDQKIWEVVRSAERVEVTGIQGTKFDFTWFPEWWELVEGTHPKIKGPGHLSTFNALRPGRSEHAVFAGHLMLHPRYGAIEGADAQGVLVSQFGEWDPMWPPMSLQLDHGEIVGIKEGAHYGDFWRESLELTKDIIYPGHSRPGTAWMSEFSLGTNPKVIGAMRVEELKGLESQDPMILSWGDPRDRAGYIHSGFGARGASWWAEPYQMPVNHYHQFFPFITYDVITRDGRKVRLIDKGNLTMLDDPEVRAMAATFGDPDKLLSVDWVPEITPEGKIIPPESSLIPYDEWVANLPFRLDDPKLVYQIPDKLEKFYGEDRVTYYDPNEFMEFYKKIGQIPVKRVESN